MVEADDDDVLVVLLGVEFGTNVLDVRRCC